MKKIKALISAAIVTAMAFSTAFSAFAADITIGETELKQAAELTEGSTEIGNLQLAGSPTLAYVDGKGLMISGRTADWNAIDVLFANLEAGKTYILEADFMADTALEFKIGDADSPYSVKAQSDGAVTSATLSVEFTTTDEDGSIMSDGQNRYRLQTTGTDDYYISEVRIAEVMEETAEDTTGGATDTTLPTPTDKGAAPTGVEDVAIIAGLAVLAAGGIFISRKK